MCQFNSIFIDSSRLSFTGHSSAILCRAVYLCESKFDGINISKKSEINDCLFATSGENKTGIKVPNRKSGCAALDLAYVAAGRFDGFFQKNLNLWDIAAGLILIKEAGGIINNIDLDKTQNIKVIASSVNIGAKLEEKLHNF